MTRRQLIAGATATIGAVALLTGCGGSSKGLLPTTDAGSLQNDFANIEQFVSVGNCAKALGWVASAQRHLAALPSSVDAGLRAQLQVGVVDLAAAARRECAANATASTSTTSTSSSSSTPQTSSQTSSSQTATTTASSTTASTPSPSVTTSSPSGGVSPTTSSATLSTGQAAPGGGAGANGVGGAGAP